MEFSDYIVYVDESGDHSLTSIDEGYPVFVLAFCVFRKEDYARIITPALQDFKFRWFGEDTVVLHEAEMRRHKGDFGFLENSSRREQFMGELNELLTDAPMTIISSVIRKQQLVRRYFQHAENPYHLSLVFCMEKLHAFLEANGQAGKTTHIIFEQRGGKTEGGKEDKELELEFFRIKSGSHYLCDQAFPDLEHRIVSKKINSGGLQIADLVARPIGVHCLRPEQDNRAFNVIEQKIATHPSGSWPKNWGLKIFP